MKYLFLLIPFILVSCVGLRDSHYEKIPEKAKKYFLEFSPSIPLTGVSYNTPPHIYEITGQHIKDLSLNSSKKVWVHFFAPWCRGDSTGGLEQMQAFQQRYTDKLILMLVSTSYDYDYLVSTLYKSKLTVPVYVLDARKYGTHITKTEKKFYKEVSHKNDNTYFNDYLIDQGRLIYERPWKVSMESLYQKIGDIVTSNLQS